MIEIDKENETYVCPYCKMQQAFSNSYSYDSVGFYDGKRGTEERHIVYSIKCTNKSCNRISIVAFGPRGNQHDILPEFTYNEYPDYIPAAIRNDYREAVAIIDKSPKAAATLFRRCLQGMISDFFNINKKTLAESIDQLKDKIPKDQWAAIDKIRKIGNVGAHMEKDINLIIDIKPEEATILKTVIESLLKNWYIARHDDQETYNSIYALASKIDKQKEGEGKP